MFVHVGHNCRHDAIRLAQQAQSVGADAVAVHAPSWWKALQSDTLIEFCEPIAAAAPELAFYLYDIPDITGVTASTTCFLAAAKERIPNLAGVKYTNADLTTAQECIQMNQGAYDILWGADQALIAGIALALPAPWGVPTTLPHPCTIAYSALWRSTIGELLVRSKREPSPWSAAIQHFDLLAALKFTMSLAGIDCGPVRAPVKNLTAADQTKLRLELQRTGALTLE